MEYISSADPFSSGEAMGIFSGIIAVAFIVWAIIGLVPYILNGIAILNFAKRTGVKNGWLGFIPFASSWMIGRLSDVGSERRHSGSRLLTTTIITAVFGIMMVITGIVIAFSMENEDFGINLGVIISMVLSYIIIMAGATCTLVFEIMAFYRIAKNFGGESYGGYFAGIIVGIFVCPLAAFIILLILSTKTPAFTEKTGEPILNVQYDTAADSTQTGDDIFKN